MGARAVENLIWRLSSADGCPELPPPANVTLLPAQLLLEPGAPVLFVYFPVSAVVSLASMTGAGESAQMALVGSEGVVGLAGIFGTVEGSTITQVLVPGTALRVPAAAIRNARGACPSVRRVLDVYTQSRLVQVAQAVVCNRLHSVDARLSRWLLELHARIEGDELWVSHERIAELLGVHRPTVSTALLGLQQQGALARRGRTIVVTDRSMLERLACECYHTLSRDLGRAFAPVHHGPVSGARDGIDEPAQGPRGEHSSEVLREIAGRLLLVSLREQEARERAEAASLAKDIFLSTVSHELRTPLTAILGWCAIMNEDPHGTVEHGLEVIERNARAQLALVNELLDSARISAGTLTVEKAPLSMTDLARNVVDALSPDSCAKGILLDIELPGQPPPPVHGDANRLGQVLLNVLQNALKFTPKGGAVHVRVDTVNDRARVVVRDTGVGIAAALLPHVFERFRRNPAGPSGQFGLGLGLTIARAVVDLHGGTITLESEGEGRGTTCTVELPLLTTTVPEAAQPRAMTGIAPA